MNIVLRESTAEDFEFVFNLNKLNMREYVDNLRGWNDEAERAEMQKKFTPGVDAIIQADGIDVGVYRVVSEPDGWKIDHIELLPEFQNKGISTRLITELLNKARAQNKQVRLQVLKTNPALNLYERLGFTIVDQNELKYILVAE